MLAVSGGIDSMYLAERAPELFPGASFAIAHCNFGLRADESDGDEEFVRKWAHSHSLECFVKRFDTLGYAAAEGISTEMAARELRYSWFFSLCSSEGFDALAVAHHADDNSETFFLNLLRGTGLKGLRGMAGFASGDRLDSGLVRASRSSHHCASLVVPPFTRPRAATHAGANRSPECKTVAAVLRPMLGIGRREIEEWMRENGKEWREDRTNRENIYKRNILRNEVFPLFEKINPSFRRTMSENMARIAEAYDIVEDYFESCALDSERIDVAALLGFKHWRYLLYRLTEGRLNSSQLSQLEKALESGTLASGKSFGPYVTTSSEIILRPEKAARDEYIVETFGRPEDFPLKQESGVLIFDADKFPSDPVLRPWKEGDWMVPFGMKGKKKISDLFVDLKWSLADKEAAMVVEYPGDPTLRRVAALLPVRSDDSLKVTPETKRILRIRLGNTSNTQ